MLDMVCYLPPIPDGAYFDEWLAWRLAQGGNPRERRVPAAQWQSPSSTPMR